MVIAVQSKTMKARFRFVRYTAAVLSVVSVAIVAMLLSSSYVSAEGIKIIDGYVKDSVGRVLEGANVVLEVWKPDLTLRFTDSYVADEDGYYSFTLSSFLEEFHDGDTFEVTANYNGAQHNESELDDGQPIQRIDIIYPYEIPQFGSLVGFGVAAGAVGLIAMVFVVKRKNH